MRCVLAAVLLTAAAGCKDEAKAEQTLIPGVPDELLDPATCEECHPEHYRQWLGSMHAYAVEDPIFRAMNARGQRETDGALGDFCIKCHAPLAVELGLTTDGLNMDEVPQSLHGVTCYFCHTVTGVAGTHNNPLELSMGAVMLGNVRDPEPSDVHEADYSSFLDSATLESGDMCGSCHDIVTDAGLHLERTYSEWLDSFFADEDPLSGGPQPYGLRCASCHMGPGTVGPIADAEGVRADRVFHPHGMVGVDVAITDYPDAQLGPMLVAEQQEQIAEQRKSALCSSLCVGEDDDGNPVVDHYVHNEFSAHGWPSGATADRRTWAELHVFGADGPLLETGELAPGQAVVELQDSDPNLRVFHSRLFDGAGEEVHMFWDAEAIEGEALPAASVLSPQGDAGAWKGRRYVMDAPVERVTAAVHIRAVGLDVIDSLIESGDLDASFRDRFPVEDVAPTLLEWTPEAAQPAGEYGSCVSSSDACGAATVGAPIATPEG